DAHRPVRNHRDKGSCRSRLRRRAAGRRTRPPFRLFFGTCRGFAASPPGEEDVASEDAMLGAIGRQKSKGTLGVEPAVNAFGFFSANFDREGTPSLAGAVEPSAPDGGEAGALAPALDPFVSA